MDIIRTENKGYAAYEEALLHRDQLRKEAHICQGLYMKEFGDLIIAVFEKKVSCIEKKKIISYCQMALNRGSVVDREAMQNDICSEMEQYRNQLDDMVQQNEASKQIQRISSETVAKIKKLYHKLAKLLHPDINPKTEQVPELKNLWQMVKVSYTANNLEELEEAEFLIRRALEKNDFSSVEMNLADLPEKMKKVEQDIHDIESTTPYQYKYLLQDDEAVNKRKEELRAELAEYETYEKELEQVITDMLGSGVKVLWRMI